MALGKVPPLHCSKEEGSVEGGELELGNEL